MTTWDTLDPATLHELRLCAGLSLALAVLGALLALLWPRNRSVLQAIYSSPGAYELSDRGTQRLDRVTVGMEWRKAARVFAARGAGPDSMDGSTAQRGFGGGGGGGGGGVLSADVNRDNGSVASSGASVFATPDNARARHVLRRPSDSSAPHAVGIGADNGDADGDDHPTPLQLLRRAAAGAEDAAAAVAALSPRGLALARGGGEGVGGFGRSSSSFAVSSESGLRHRGGGGGRAQS